MALGRSARSSTNSTYIDWRSGRSNAVHVPSQSASTIRCQTSIVPVAVSTARTIACTSISDCVTSSAAPAIDAIGEHAGEVAEDEDADVRAERHHAEEPAPSR